MNPVLIRDKGFTMVELMISMALGLLVSGAAVVIVINAMKQLNNTQNFSEIVDNGRIVLSMMGEDIAHAGFMGELSGQTLDTGSGKVTVLAGNPTNDCSGSGLNNGSFPQVGAVATFRMLWGETVTSAKSMDCMGSDASTRIGTDLVQVKRLIGRADTTATMVGNIGDSIIMATDTNSAVIYSNTGTAPDASTLPGTPSYYEYQNRVYYIREISRYGETNFPVLVRENLGSNGNRGELTREEIAEGVDDMRLLYGIDANGDGSVNRYVNANDVGADDWDNVDHARIISIKVGLLMRAIEADPAFIGEAVSYTYAGETAVFAGDNADGIRRKVLETTIALKNYQIANGL